MIRKTLLTASVTFGLALAISSPAQATWYGGCKRNCGGTTSSTSGSTKVPEPGMLGLMGAGLAGLAIARRRKSKQN
ncbi:hypothetical protein HNO88_000018 [Novosphingobium chloroacetimidivorans]|uniref:Ice-binding protein C-terminal domain-containing protein n=1 Tax=Novosphingobium chloroacetimidivorans TaxID=1428314 RepID=A0A7W7K5U3_9SPHN|nr:PEP-CTERM sorting domain-containing protein [Novosphingobium chloroacetimidivorans]MBB4856721.1 hypothetical protein [Novosphingobium chloroacetimidivorans]